MGAAVDVGADLLALRLVGALHDALRIVPPALPPVAHQLGENGLVELGQSVSTSANASGRSWLMCAFMPVSYTHLDVYKRQGQEH